MFKNVYYDRKNNKIHLWYDDNGKSKYVKENWVPYIYVKTKENTGTKSINGKNARKMKFKSYYEYEAFGEKSSLNIYENKIKVPELQYLSEKYHHIPDDQIVPPPLKTYSIDIEVKFNTGVMWDRNIKKAMIKSDVNSTTIIEDINVLKLSEIAKSTNGKVYYWSEEFEIMKEFTTDDFVENTGFPSPQEVKHEVCAITIFDCNENKAIVFGEHEYNTDDKSIHYVRCKNEKEILKNFFLYMKKHPPCVITGWNCYGFDLPYIINRSKKVFSGNVYKNMSPIGVVSVWEKHSQTLFDIAGVTVLDYYDLYKYYSSSNLESYRLDFVCKHELGTGKIDYSEYKDLGELYRNNWKKFIEYNITDARRVKELEDKLGYIKLAQYLSLLAKCPLKYHDTLTAFIEGVLLVYYRRNNLCAPFFRGGEDQTFTAAYVKEPQKGMFDWVVSIDIASSYPSHMIALNMSDETYLGRIIDSEENIINSIRKQKFEGPVTIRKYDKERILDGERLNLFNEMVISKKVSIAPCGTVFKTSPMGVFPGLLRYMFIKRKEFKTKIKKLRSSKEKDKVRNKIDHYDAIQKAMKIILNAVYGVCSVSYSRYYNLDISKAVASCGRHTIKQGEKFINEILANPPGEMKKLLETIDK